jgi:hypothetical protein
MREKLDSEWELKHGGGYSSGEKGKIDPDNPFAEDEDSKLYDE